MHSILIQIAFHFKMMKFNVMCLHVVVLALSAWSVTCLNQDEEMALVGALKPMINECMSDCGIEEDFKKKDDSIDPCFKRCFMKKVGLVDENGKYNREAVHDAILELTENKDEAKKIQDQLDNCFDAKGNNDGDDEESEMKRIDVLLECMKAMKVDN